MSNSLIKTSDIETLPKNTSQKRSSGNFCTSSSSPFPRAKNLKRGSLKMSVSRSFGKLRLFSPMLVGCCQCHITRRLGAWTPPTLNQSSALSAVLKIAENGGWSTAVVRWLMRYSLRRISRPRHDRASEPSSNALALRVAPCFCPVVCPALFGTAVSSLRASGARVPGFRFRTTSPSLPILLTMPFPLLQVFFPFTYQVLRYFRHILTRVIATRARAWARAIAIQAAVEVVERMRLLAVERAARCVSFSFHFDNTDVPQGERDGRGFDARVRRQHR